jgi:hypothetical protein
MKYSRRENTHLPASAHAPLTPKPPNEPPELAQHSAYTWSSLRHKGATSHKIGLFGYISLSGEFCVGQFGNVKMEILL